MGLRKQILKKQNFDHLILEEGGESKKPTRGRLKVPRRVRTVRSIGLLTNAWGCGNRLSSIAKKGKKEVIYAL